MTAAFTVHTLDLKFQGYPKAIASYLISHPEGGALVECGPGSTLPRLQEALRSHDVQPEDITDVLLTHIHLDHAGSAGWWARQGARIHVHEVGAPHMIDPSKLLASAGRIYGDRMEELWGEFLPVPEDQLIPLQDGDSVQVGDLVFAAVDTPGHAYHHMAYLINGLCFSGDIGGVRIPTSGPRHIRIPMPPPELHLELWKESVKKLQDKNISRIAPTHFGIFDDPDWHLEKVLEEIDHASAWMFEIMPQSLEVDRLRDEFIRWTTEKSLQEGLAREVLEPFEKANPSGMSADGIKRYWEKHVLDE
jgi:glyoxylase-like metal-dependent hydrolase (beta-lactamase superfamily II)